MASLSTKLVHFTRFKNNVYDDALAVLKTSDPEYVLYVQQHRQDPDPASVVGRKPGRPLPKNCQKVLEALVSYELDMGQVKTSLKFLGMRCPLPNTLCTQGQWTVYCFDAWMNLAYSWQEKLDLLVKRVCRWKKLDCQKSNSIVSELRTLRTNFNTIRGGYVHETGAVSGISEGPGWELNVALRLDVANHQQLRLHEYANGKWQDWSVLLFAATTKQLANLEAFFQQLNIRIWPPSTTASA